MQNELKNLRTSCYGCVFNKNGCKLEKQTKKDVVQGNIIQFVDGFCRHKRRSAKTLEEIHQEERKLTYIHNSKEFNPDLEFDWLPDNVTHVYIVTQDKTAVVDASRMKLGTREWTLEKILVEPPSEEQIINAVIPKLKTNWFVYGKFDFVIVSCCMFESFVEQEKNNFVGFYDDHGILTHKIPFENCNGNEKDMLFSEKIKTFNNWSNLWHKI